MEQAEFDKIYGARQGRKLRIGHSLQVGLARTMEEQRMFLHPKLRDFVKQAYME